MRTSHRALGAIFVLLALVFPLTASASHGSADDASPNMVHLANLPTPAEFTTCNRGSAACFDSDLAFWAGGGLHGGYTEILAQGNYEGFRLVDISNPATPATLSVVECRTNQGDVSFYQARNRLLLIQSIEEPVSSPDCATAFETPIVPGTNPVTLVTSTFRTKGFEGLRIFDVSDPTAPVHIASVRTRCGSHTHTTIRDDRNRRGIVYVSSYPSGLRVTRLEDLALLPEQPNCLPDHNRISIVEIPDADPAAARVLKEQPLDSDTQIWSVRGNGGSNVRGCHDITVFRSGSTMVAGGACLSEGQLWDVSDPANPTANVSSAHTHIRNAFIDPPAGPFRGLFHTASFSWDGKVVLFTDEWGGGGAHGCDGPTDHRGNVWFYDNVAPGTSVAPLRGRYILPRVQPSTEACTMHNGNVIPTTEGYFGVSSAYLAGTSVFDFTDVTTRPEIPQPLTGSETIPVVATEVAYFDAKSDPAVLDDAWSSYWHNNYVYASSGLQRPGRRGLDVYMLLGANGRLVPEVTDPSAPNVGQYRAKILRYQNPQTQD